MFVHVSPPPLCLMETVVKVSILSFIFLKLISVCSSLYLSQRSDLGAITADPTSLFRTHTVPSAFYLVPGGAEVTRRSLNNSTVDKIRIERFLNSTCFSYKNMTLFFNRVNVMYIYLKATKKSITMLTNVWINGMNWFSNYSWTTKHLSFCLWWQMTGVAGNNKNIGLEQMS